VKHTDSDGNEHLIAGTVSEEAALTEFEARYRREYGVFYEFLMSFYQMHWDEDSYFWEAKKVTNSEHVTEFEAFVELVAGVSSGESALTEAAALIEHFRTNSDELATAVDNIADGAPGGSSSRRSS
jgi:halogenation protein CepH